MKELIQESQLESVWLADTEFLLKTQQQLSKDFEKCGFSFPRTFQTELASIDDIKSLIESRVLDIMEQGERSLLQLLYTVDLPEKKFLQLTTQDNFLPTLSHKILLREAMKVWLRQHYSTRE
jgi:hypothetical protein